MMPDSHEERGSADGGLMTMAEEIEVVPTFRALAEDVLRMRDEQGIRGIAKERSRYARHVSTAQFAKQPITDIKAREIRGWLRDMAAKDKLSGTPGKLDRATVNRAFSLVSAVFVEAVEQDLIETNPCLGVKPKKRVTAGDTVEKWSYLTVAEQRAIVDCPVVSDEHKLAIRFAFGTGLRQSEMTNLELADLHVTGDAPHVFVRYSVPHKGEKRPPKNGKKRSVPLMPDALDAARKWLALLPTFAPSNPHSIVFPSRRGDYRQQGRPLDRATSIHDVYRAAGVPARKGLHWHALRHTFCTNLISGALGRPWRPEEIMSLSGHSSLDMVMRYAHLSNDAITRAVAETIAAVMPPPPPDTEPLLEIPELAEDTIRDLGALLMEVDDAAA